MKNEITVQTIQTQIHDWAPSLKDFALTEFNQDRFFKTAVMAILETPALMECMQTPDGRASLYSAMKRAFSTGLSLNPQEGKAAIIAYKGKASYQIMKEGAIEILLNSGDIKSLMVEIVYENDKFNIEKSNDGDVYHFAPTRKNRGEVDGYFCAITDNDDISHVKYMTREECLEIRDGYSAMYKASPNTSPWKNSEKGMCKKTVIKAAIRDLHISPKAKAIFSSEDVNFSEPEIKNITPEKLTGNTADDVANKLDSKKENKGLQQAENPPPMPPVKTTAEENQTTQTQDRF